MRKSKFRRNGIRHAGLAVCKDDSDGQIMTNHQTVSQAGQITGLASQFAMVNVVLVVETEQEGYFFLCNTVHL